MGTAQIYDKILVFHSQRSKKWGSNKKKKEFQEYISNIGRTKEDLHLLLCTGGKHTNKE